MTTRSKIWKYLDKKLFDAMSMLPCMCTIKRDPDMAASKRVSLCFAVLVGILVVIYIVGIPSPIAIEIVYLESEGQSPVQQIVKDSKLRTTLRPMDPGSLDRKTSFEQRQITLSPVAQLGASNKKYSSPTPQRKDSERTKKLISSIKKTPIQSSEETMFSGRSADDGAWYSVPGDYEIYLYTAFYDNRISIGALPNIRIVSVAQDLDKVPPFYCVVNYYGEIGIRHNEAMRIEIGAGAYRHNQLFREYLLSCQLKTEHIPISVGISYTNYSEPKFMLPVEHIKPSGPKKHIAACVSVSYWMIEPYKIVEWLELQRILGMDKVIVYNNSLSKTSAEIFQHYAKTDFLEFRQSHNFMDDRGEQTLHLHMSPVINDCMYRYMFDFKYLEVIDMDEIIVPHLNNTLKEMLQQVDNNEPAYHPAPSYVFRNAYFFFDFEQDEFQDMHFRTLRYRKRLEVSELGYSAKSIINPLSCHAMHNHYCWGVNALYEDGNHMIFVEPEVALLHHYKKCHLDSFEIKPGECKRLMETSVQDDRIMFFKDKLEAAVKKQLRLLGL